MDNDRNEVYGYIMNADGMIKMSTFAIFDGVVNKDYVVVHSAPPRVTREIITRFKMVSVSEQGMLIPLAKKESK
jgi:hypothetical protein